jgi:hypothetical protein
MLINHEGVFHPEDDKYFLYELTQIKKHFSRLKTLYLFNNMNKTITKVALCLALMTAFLIMAFLAKDFMNSKLFISLGILSGAFTSQDLTTQTKKQNEYN